MRKLVFAINTTADGCCDHTKVLAEGAPGIEDLHEYYTRLLRDVDVLVFGRKTYELMVPFWPDVARTQSESDAMNEFARTFDSIDKLVFTRTLNDVDGTKTRIAGANLRDEILRLKQEEGKNIFVGGVSLPSQLIELGLVDEYHFVITPVIAGEGQRLFEGRSLPDRLQLRLAESKILRSGYVALRYVNQRI